MHEHCAVCNRVKWGEVALLGYGKWRHGECYPGSLPWLEYFKALPEEQQTTEGRLLWAYRQGATCRAGECDTAKIANNNGRTLS